MFGLTSSNERQNHMLPLDYQPFIEQHLQDKKQNIFIFFNMSQIFFLYFYLHFVFPFFGLRYKLHDRTENPI